MGESTMTVKKKIGLIIGTNERTLPTVDSISSKLHHFKLSKMGIEEFFCIDGTCVVGDMI